MHLERTKSTAPHHIFLLAQPRTTSHLLTKILGLDKQPQLHWDIDKTSRFSGTRRLTTSLCRKALSQWTEEEKLQMKARFQQCFDMFEETRSTGEKQGKVVFAKEHCNLLWNPAAGATGTDYSPEIEFFKVTVPATISCNNTENENPTVFPTEYLALWQPIFLIRHPALAFPSYCRGMLELQEIKHLYPDTEHMLKDLCEHMSFSYTRQLYDWYLSYYTEKDGEDGRNRPYPILLDSDDIINRAQIAYDLAERLGLNRSAVQLSWSPRGKDEESDDMRRTFLRTLDASHGIEKNMSRIPLKENGNIDGAEWKEEFGDHFGELILDCVRGAMADYEYLKGRRFQEGCMTRRGSAHHG